MFEDTINTLKAFAAMLTAQEDPFVFEFIDVSKWQGALDWAKANTSAAFIKAIEYYVPDPMFAANWRGSKEHGVKRGAYLYYRDEADPKIQVRKLRDLLDEIGEGYGELPPACDVEETNNPKITLARLRTCLDEFELIFGRKPAIYTRAEYFNRAVSGGKTWVKDYPLWVAHYPWGKWQGETHAKKALALSNYPTLPTGWSEYAVWQITDKAPGVRHGVSNKNTVDLNVMSEKAALAWGLIAPPPGTPPPVIPPPTSEVRFAEVQVDRLKLRFTPYADPNDGNLIERLTVGEIVKYAPGFTQAPNETDIWWAVLRTNGELGFAAHKHFTLGGVSGLVDRPDLLQ